MENNGLWAIEIGLPNFLELRAETNFEMIIEIQFLEILAYQISNRLELLEIGSKIRSHFPVFFFLIYASIPIFIQLTNLKLWWLNYLLSKV